MERILLWCENNCKVFVGSVQIVALFFYLFYFFTWILTNHNYNDTSIEKPKKSSVVRPKDADLNLLIDTMFKFIDYDDSGSITIDELFRSFPSLLEPNVKNRIEQRFIEVDRDL